MADQTTQQNPYAAFGGTVDTPTPAPTQAAPSTAPASPTPASPNPSPTHGASAPDPYAAFGGSVDKPDTSAGASTSGGAGPKDAAENTIWAGFTDKIGRAASGLWELTKAQAGHVYDQMERPIHDVAQGHYKQGVMDALRATILPDLESPTHHVIRGMVMDSLHNLKDAGSEELQAMQEEYRFAKAGFTPNKTAAQRAEQRGHAVQAEGHSAGAVLSGIKAVAPGLVESGAEIANPKTTQHGIGGALGEAAMIVGPEVAGKVGTGLTKAVGRGLERFGMKEIGGLLRSTSPRDYFYGADPRQAIIDEKIAPKMSLEGVRDQLEAAQDRLETEVRQKLGTSKTQDLDVVPVIQNTTQGVLKEISQTRGFTSEQRMDLVKAIQDYRDNLLSGGFDPQTGKSLGNVTKTRLGPDDVAELRRDVGKSTRWNRGNVDPAISTWMNNYQKEIYAKLNDMIESAESGTKTLNKRIQNSIGAIRLIDKQIPREEFTNIGVQRFMRKAEIGAGAELIGTGHPVAGTALLANRALRSTPGRVAAGRGAVAAGNVLQGGTPAGAAGQVAQGIGSAAKMAASTGGGAAASQVGQAAENQGIENWIPIETSDGARHLIHPEDLEEAKKRDPKLKVLTNE